MSPWPLYFAYCLFHVLVDDSSAQGCSLLPADGGLAYRQYVQGSGIIVRNCPPGTAFSIDSCSCSLFINEGVIDNRQQSFSGNNPNLASLFPILTQNSINKQTGQTDVLLSRDQSSLYQRYNAAREGQAMKSRNLAPAPTLKPRKYDPLKMQVSNNGRFRNQAIMPSQFLSGQVRNDQLGMNQFANNPILSALAFEKVQEMALEAAMGF